MTTYLSSPFSLSLVLVRSCRCGTCCWLRGGPINFGLRLRLRGRPINFGLRLRLWRRPIDVGRGESRSVLSCGRRVGWRLLRIDRAPCLARRHHLSLVFGRSILVVAADAEHAQCGNQNKCQTTFHLQYPFLLVGVCLLTSRNHSGRGR